ncbi:restriction endonuclease subunit S [Micromonospora sp. DSM 115977]|uniref:Restriction endonuclease subunit S n=1 Tax=Micromonospora reichwaldensis TaxID=3075516 RepID=A0ABU2X0S8_9ACTN|nr:restriction endonuclease subunit S [Micromonospora sp. DSM 115977]MDT0531779.1 restriction endonuclease subunit S [Micromonospora sp. DSM 115977]
MTDLPEGWTEVRLDDIALSVKNGIFVSRPGVEPDGVPILRISAVRPGRLRAEDVRYTGKSAEDLGESDSLLHPGDLLFTRYNGNIDLVGACAIVPQGVGQLTYPDKLIRVQTNPETASSACIAYLLQSPQLRSRVRALARTTAGQAGISGASLRSVGIPLPPLAEQRRIVAALEDHLSRLDAATRSIGEARRRLRNLRKRVIVEAVPIHGREGWSVCSVGEAGSVDLGRQRHPDWHQGPDMKPYLRVANVFEDRIDTTDVMEMDFPPRVFERFRLQEGDILLNEGQSPEFLGRPAMYRGIPAEAAFTNSLLRFRAGAGIDPEWALLVFRRHMHAGRFSREVRITTNIAHLSAGRFKAVEFPIPPLAEQRAIVGRTKDLLAGLDRLSAAVERSERQATALRASLLAEAFAGRLVPQDPNDEPASDLLARIRAERQAALPKQKARSPRTRRDLAAPPTRVTGDDYQQETLPL